MNNRIERLLGFLKDTPQDQFVIHALALEYAKEQNWDEAIAYFEKNIAIDPQYVATYYHLGKVQEQMGKEEDAIVTYAKGMDVAKAIGDAHAFGELRSVYEELTF